MSPAGALLLLLPLGGCFLHRPPAPPVAPVAGDPTAEISVSPAPLSFELLDQRISALLPVVEGSDQRDRLQALRSLLADMRGQDPAAQRAVYNYAAAVLTVEERVMPVPIDAGDGGFAPIEETPLQADPAPPSSAPPTSSPTSAPSASPAPPPASPTPAPPPASPASSPTSAPPASPSPPPLPPPDLSPARLAVSQGRFLDAVALLDTLPPSSDPDAGRALRREAVDAWARGEREKAGTAFLTARELPAGPERTTALRAVRDELQAINTRFPDNAYAAAIAENLERVELELSREGAPAP